LSRAVEGSAVGLAFVFVFVLAFLAVIPAGNLLFGRSVIQPRSRGPVWIFRPGKPRSPPVFAFVFVLVILPVIPGENLLGFHRISLGQ
jgi:hypothetical protein